MVPAQQQLLALCDRLDTRSAADVSATIYLLPPEGSLYLGGDPTTRRELHGLAAQIEPLLHQLGTQLPEGSAPEVRLVRWAVERTQTDSVGAWTAAPVSDANPLEFSQLPDHPFRIISLALRLFCARPPAADNTEQYVYHRNGSQFEVRYGAEGGIVPVDLDGAWYVYWLLQKPNTPMSATELRQRLAQEKLVCSSVMTAQGLVEHEQPAGGPIEDTADEIEQLQRGAMGLAKQIREASASKDQAQVERLLDDLNQVKKQIDSLKTPGGAPRRIAPEADRKAVSRAIARVREKCRSAWAMPKLAKHLSEHIDTGATPAYRPPDPAPDWNF